MNNELTINFTINDINAFQERYKAFLQLSPKERYNIIKDTVLASDTVVFYNMTGGFMAGAKESPCMDILKSGADMYESAVIGYPVKDRTEHIEHHTREVFVI